VSGREDYSQVLMTFHPRGGRSSAQWFHDDPWLDFNMQQNGHCNDTDVAGRIARDYARHPVKPVLDGEPLYENFSMCFSADRPLSDAYEVRNTPTGASSPARSATRTATIPSGRWPTTGTRR
jgi:Protein of unknown function (DUF4038)